MTFQYLSTSSSLSIHPHNSQPSFLRLLFSPFYFSVSHLFSSVSVITSICFLHPPSLSLPPAHFLPPLISPSFLLLVVFVTRGRGRRCRGSFPNLLILSFFIGPSLRAHKHRPQSPPLPLPTTTFRPPPSSPVPVCPWHKCICSIPPANRLVGCYQRQGDGDNGFHHIFSLPQIKMGQVTQRTHARTHTHTNAHTQSPIPTKHTPA